MLLNGTIPELCSLSVWCCYPVRVFLLLLLRVCVAVCCCRCWGCVIADVCYWGCGLCGF